MPNPPMETAHFSWRPESAAAAAVTSLLDEFLARSAAAENLRERLLRQTGTRLFDWIDHLVVPASDSSADRLAGLGFSPRPIEGATEWTHARGLLPPLLLARRDGRQLAIRVESVVDFLRAHRLPLERTIEGPPLAALRKVRAAAEGNCELWAVERHGAAGYAPSAASSPSAEALATHAEAFRRRRRSFPTASEGFDHASRLIAAAARDLGPDRACDLFFAAEREYWQSRNRAAQVQRVRQDALGLGWANHDHHTFRSSRDCFTRLVGLFEQLGFICRERFYGGREAGWGAQVLEHPGTRIVIFADVDLSPKEVSGDFAHEPLPRRERLGTVGLWCALHGEAFLQAGMHHLECQFDFAAARDQLARSGIETMPPFTDLPYLKQAFTVGERWPVDEARLAALVADGLLSADEQEQFRRQGAIGSHLELLQRDDGYKGFNQTGISEIIARTNPRLHSPGDRA